MELSHSPTARCLHPIRPFPPTSPNQVTSFVPSVDTVPPQLRVAVEQMRAHYPNPGAMFVTIDNRSLADRQASPFHVRSVDYNLFGSPTLPSKS